MRAIVLASTALVFGMPALAAPTVKLGGSITVTEGQSAPMPIVKTGSGRAKFGIRAAADTATDQDFAPVNKVLSPYGSTAETVSTLDDATVEGSERIKVELYPVAGSKTIVDQTPQYVTVLDNDVAPVPEPVPEPTPEPTPEPAPQLPDWEAAPTLAGLASISVLDPAIGVISIPLPKTAAPDVVGAFRFVCDAGQILADDPLVYPGQPGASHLHQFYGNTEANAHSTYASLRTSGESTCSVNPLNRSAYWMPAMLDGKGNVVRPDHVQIYYKRRPKSDPKCQGFANQGEGTCVDLPNGLAFIFGFDMVTNKAPTGSIYFQCVATGVTQLHEPSLEGATIQACPAGVGGRVVATIKAPGCWDGKNTKSPNLRDHVAYAVRDPNLGFMACPKTHPYVIPGFTLTASYQIEAGDDVRLWTFASDHMRPTLPRGSTFHADFFMAWEPAIAVTWQENCVDKLLNCSAGDLGNGKQLRNVLKADAHLVPLP